MQVVITMTGSGMRPPPFSENMFYSIHMVGNGVHVTAGFCFFDIVRQIPSLLVSARVHSHGDSVKLKLPVPL